MNYQHTEDYISLSTTMFGGCEPINSDVVLSTYVMLLCDSGKAYPAFILANQNHSQT